MTMLLPAAPLRSLRLLPVAALAFAAHTMLAAPPVPLAPPATAAQKADADRSAAYYHYGLSHLYEEMAVNAGRPDYATQAIEEYKLALSADPKSPLLQDGLADLYFKIGRIREAVTAAQEQVKKNPDDLEAHMLLGKVYVRSLQDMQGTQAGEMLQLAITEYEIIARLKPGDTESKLLLGELYRANHQADKAEAQFKDAQKIDANSEEVILNMARLYREEGDAQRAADTLQSIPVTDRSARMELDLATSFDALRKPKEAAAAYRRSIGLEPDNPEALHGLANALLADGQLDAALKLFSQIVEADPSDGESQVHISDIQRRQGHYEEALATLQKAKAQVQGDSLLISYNEALIFDALGRFDQATAVLTSSLAASAHPDGKYSDQEKGNRTAFLDRLGTIYRDQNKTAEAVAVYKQIVDFGGDFAKSGYQGEIDAYRDAHQWKEATAVAAEAAKALPTAHDMQLVYAQQLADTGKVDEALALARAQLTSTTDDRDVQVRLAEIYIRLKRFKEASDQLDKVEATANKPEEKIYVLFLRGELFDRQKLYEDAESQFRKALAIDPQNPAVQNFRPGVQNYLGYMLADRGEKLPEALQLIRQAVDFDPQNPAYLDSLGWVYYKTGQFQQAEENLRKANERMNTDPTVHDHLGEVYEKTGKLRMAVAQWERSMTEYASSLPVDADPVDVQKVQHKLENARVKLAKLNTSSDKESK